MARCFKPKTSYLHSASSIPFTGMTLCDALDRSAENSPDKESFVFASKLGSKRITYRQLRQDVIKLAAGLLHLGLKPGDRVGIWFENRYEWILTQYATAYTKMMYVRFVEGYNAEYMEYLINNTKVSTLLIGSGDQEKVLLELVPELSEAGTRYIETENIPTLHRIIHLGAEEKAGMSRFVDIFELGEERDFQQVMIIRKSVKQDDEITMLFTSGSTGMPKTVVRSHRCSVENMHTFGRHIADMVNKDDIRYLSTNPFAHSGGDLGTVMVVILGFTAIIPEPKCDSSRVADLIRQERATCSFLMFHYLFDFINDPKLQNHDFSSLELLLTAGNIVPKEVLDKVRERVTPNLFNFIGSTEAGFQTFNDNNEKYDRVGLPVNHQEIKIIDDNDNIVPLYTTGELCIRSNYILLRYEGDEGKTKDDIDGSGWFHTGDLSLMEEDGCLHVMGRKKDIIIKGGRNIYPLEIERVLTRHPKVKLPQVVSVPGERLVEEICACVCLEKDQEATEDEILEFVRPILEEYLVPKYVLFFDSYPSTLTGKILRTELVKKARERLGLNK
ncbi:medium-chain acyl-CoA ligase ACSF2, mitochondrial-like [Glandiceps talaboti]